MPDSRHPWKCVTAIRPFSGPLSPIMNGPCMGRAVNPVRNGTSRLSSPAQESRTLPVSCPASLCPPLEPTAQLCHGPPELSGWHPPPPRSNVGHLREWRPRPHRQHCSGGRGCVCEVPFRTGGFIIPAVSQGHALCGSLADADARPCFLARAAQVTGACFVRLSARHGRQVMCAGACSAGTLTACSALRGGRLRRSGGVLAGTEAPGAWACGREARECVFWPVLRRSGGVLAATEAPGAWACGREARECVFCFGPARRTGT